MATRLHAINDFCLCFIFTNPFNYIFSYDCLQKNTILIISTAPEYQKLKALADKNEDLLRETLSDEQKELLDKLTECITDILYLRSGYVDGRISTRHEADDRRNERRLTAPVAPCKPMWVIESAQSEKYTLPP